jgi:DNA-binding response OmpR family regulator
MKILIVEDEKLLSRSIQEYLESSNCICEIATTKSVLQRSGAVPFTWPWASRN